MAKRSVPAGPPLLLIDYVIALMATATAIVANGTPSVVFMTTASVTLTTLASASLTANAAAVATTVVANPNQRYTMRGGYPILRYPLFVYLF